MARPKKTDDKKTTQAKVPKRSKPRTSFDQNEAVKNKAQAARKEPINKAKKAATIEIKQATNQLVQGEILSYVREALVAVDPETKKNWYQRFVQFYMADALSNPNGKPAQLLAANIFGGDVLAKLDAETDKIIAKDIAFSRYRISQTLFDKQRNVIEDRISKAKCIICGRRAGKTELNARLAVDAALQPNTPVCYIHLTFNNGIAQMFDNVVAVANAISLKIVNGRGEGDKTEGVIEFANGSSIRFRGNSNKPEAEKIRGFKYRLVIIDECQSQRNLKYLVEDIIQPLQVDYADSQLMLTGTPPRIPHTFFEKAYVGLEYKSYHWDMRDNPYIPNVNEAIEEICKKKGLTMDSPLIQREYLGVIVYDYEALVYNNYKVYEGEIPTSFIPDRAYIGVDFGFSDNNAIISLVANIAEKKGYVLCEYKFNKATITEIVNTVIKAMDKTKDFIIKRNKNVDINGCINIFCDTNEKSIAYELYQTYRLPANCAYKYDKNMAIEQLAEWMRVGTITTIKDGIVADECEHTVHPRDDDTDAILPGYDDDVYHPDALDALLYASRQFAFDIGDDTGGQGKAINE